MNKKRRYYQDGGDTFDTSVFGDIIDEVVEGESEDEVYGFDENATEEESETYIGSDDEEAQMTGEDEPDIFDMLMNDDSFDIPATARANRATSDYARFETKREAIGKSQLDRNMYAYDFYKNMGLSDIQSAAIVGNLAQESGIRALNYGDRDSKGVAQWRTDRYQPMMRWAKANGKDFNNLDTQLEYVAVEAQQRGDLQRIAGYTDVKQATLDFGRKFERPSEKHADWGNRFRHAESVFNTKQHGGEVDTYQYGGFKVPQPEQFKVKTETNPNRDLLNKELITMIGDQEFKQVVPITSEPEYLKFRRQPTDEAAQPQTGVALRGTGRYELPDSFKMFNTLAQGTTFIANMLNARRQRQREQEQLDREQQKPQYDNYGIGNISNIPNYNI